MNFQTSSGFDHFSLDPPLASLSSHSSQNLPQNPLNSDRIPPPASVATINGDAIDLNDEVFFHTAQNSASSVALNSNYLLDSYHIDPVSFGPDISPSAPSGPLVSPSVSHAYLGSSPSHLQVKVPASAILKNPFETLDVKNALDLASFVPESGAPRGLESDMSQGSKSALSTPVLAFAEPMSYNVHYSHQNRFSTAVEQMNRMSLHTRSSSIDLIPEEKTINPRQLLDCSATSSLASLQNYSLGGSSEKEGDSCMQAAASPPDTATLKFSAPGKSGQPYSSPSSKTAPVPNRYLSTSVSSPSLSTFFSSHVPDNLDGQGSHSAISALNNPLNPYVMNDECVSAITYWLNNTADVIQEKEKDSAQSAGGHGALKHPVRGSSISKAHWNRRNSIQVVSGSEDGPQSTKTSVQKRKRRKSDHLSVKEEKSTFADFKFMPRASDSAPDPGFAVISESDPSVPSAMSSFSDFPEQELDKKDEALDAGDPRGADISRTASDLAHGLLAEGEDDGPKPFPCPDCEKQFKRSEHLKRHIRSVHSNIRPFHCKYCEKKFSRSDNLAQHSKTHFKINANGTTTVIYGNPNPHNRGGRKQSMSEMELH